jgi:glycosyltransferase involved in cell wall biosynthesis
VTTRLALASIAVEEAMGQQVYERELVGGAAAALGSGESPWEVDHFEIASLRAATPADARIPSFVFTSSSSSIRNAVGRLIYRKYDIVHRLDLRLPPAPHPEILTILDVVPWRFPDEGQPSSDAAASARRADVVICPSEFSAEEVTDTLGVADPVVIPLGVSPEFERAVPLTEERLRVLGIRTPFVLHAGGCTDRKNLAGLAEAWAFLHQDHPDVTLVLMGPSNERRDRLFAPLPATVRTGWVDDATARGIMAAASAVVVPSLYEGFGLPVLEGMAVGVPVVAARRSSLPEVCGDAAYLVEPDGRSLALGLEAALTDGSETTGMVERGRRRAAEFTWQKSLAAHATIWRSFA